MNQFKPTLLLLLSCCPGFVLAAPQLNMHVFDEGVSQANNVDTPGLKMHVFEGGQQEKAVVAELKKQPSAKQSKSLISYDDAKISLRAGYRKDQLDFNIPGPGGSPNILSELQWDNLESLTISADTEFVLNKSWLLNVDFTYGRILNGQNQDSDYDGDDRTLEFSRSRANSKGDVYDISLSTGYRFNPDGVIEIRPLIGLSYHAQNFRDLNGVQLIPDEGRFNGLDSNYDSTWFGPWVGLESLFNLSDNLNFGLGVELHYAKYDSTADWNLRSDRAHPESFTMEATGHGVVSYFSGEYALDTDLSIALLMKYQDWKANQDGKYTSYWADGTNTEYGFNHASWEAFEFNLGVNYVF
jgi:hypothetical protein